MNVRLGDGPLSLAGTGSTSSDAGTSGWTEGSACDAFTRCGKVPRSSPGDFVLSWRTRSKMRVANGIKPARMIATQSGSIFIHATL